MRGEVAKNCSAVMDGKMSVLICTLQEVGICVVLRILASDASLSLNGDDQHAKYRYPKPASDGPNAEQ